VLDEVAVPVAVPELERVPVAVLVAVLVPVALPVEDNDGRREAEGEGNVAAVLVADGAADAAKGELEADTPTIAAVGVDVRVADDVACSQQ
jgi:hypothetical protein